MMIYMHWASEIERQKPKMWQCWEMPQTDVRAALAKK